MIAKKKTDKKTTPKKKTVKKTVRKNAVNKKPRKKRGRKTKMTDDRIRVFTEAILKLRGRVSACKIAEIDYQTFLNWMRDDNDFFELITRVERQATELEREFLEAAINTACQDGDWRAAAWKLEHKRAFRGDYSREETINLNDVTIRVGYGDEEEV